MPESSQSTSAAESVDAGERSVPESAHRSGQGCAAEMLLADAEQGSATRGELRQKSRRVISPPKELAFPRPLLTDERRHADRDKNIRDFDTELGNVPSRWLSREPGRIFIVHACEVGGIGQQNADLDDVFQ